MTRRSILLVTRVPLRLELTSGFAPRLHRFAQVLAAEHDLHVLGVRVGAPHIEGPFVDPAINAASVTVVEPGPSPLNERSVRGRARRYRHYASDRLPYAAHPQRLPALEAVLAERHVDLVILHLPHLAHLALALPPDPQVLLFFEEDLLGSQLDLRKLPWHRRAVMAIERRRQVRLYREAGRRAARVVVISGPESAQLADVIDAARIHVIEHGIDCDYYQPNGKRSEVVDVATFGWLQGSSIELARQAVLAAHARGYTWRWRFVGGNSAEVVAPLGELAEATGPLEDLRPEYEHARVVLVPADKGSGVKTTLLQAWAMQRPVVTTRDGARGLPARENENVLVADNATGLVEAIAELLADEALRRRLAEAGHRAAQPRDIGRLAHEFLAVCEEAIDAGDRDTPDS